MTTPKFEYNPNIPNTGDDLATSQGNFLSNFQQLYNAFAKNHVPLDGGADAGNHTFIELLNNPTGFETSAGEISLHASPVPNQTGQLFLRYQGNSVGSKDVQYTNYQIYDQGEIQPGQFGNFTTLPGGVIVYFGAVSFSATNLGRTLYLDPFITKKLLSVNFCPFGLNPLTIPDFEILSERQGYVTTILPRQIAPGVVYYYLIVGKT